MRLSVLIISLLLFVTLIHAKRGSSGRGRNRGSSSAGYSPFSRRNKGASETKPIPKETVQNVQSVPERKVAPPTMRSNIAPTMRSNIAKSVAPPTYRPRQIVARTNSPQQVAPPPYSAHDPNGGRPPYSPHNAHHVAPPAYSQYPQHYPQNHGYGYPQQSSWFGNKKSGYGYGGYGGYPYGVKKSGGFFGKHAFRNIMGGLFVWYMVSGLLKTPYRVYNYNNKPEVQEDITLPANVLMLCNENATNVCVPGSTAICTQDHKVLCVSSMTSADPCKDDHKQLCVNSTIPCIDAQDPLCQNKTGPDNTATVNVPCFTNLNLQTSPNGTQNVSLPPTVNNQYCVTAMAVPDPSIPPPEQLEATIEANANKTMEAVNGTTLNSTSSNMENSSLQDSTTSSVSSVNESTRDGFVYLGATEVEMSSGVEKSSVATIEGNVTVAPVI